MKKLFFIISFLSTIVIYPQTQIGLTEELQKLKNEKIDLGKRIAKIDNKINAVEQTLEEIRLSQIGLNNAYLSTVSDSYLMEEPSIFSKKLIKVPKGSKILVTDFEETFWKARFENTDGYIIKLNVEKSDVEQIFKAKNNQIDKKIASKKEQERQESIELARKTHLKKMIAKYGEPKGKTIANKKISIGMTEEMVLDSWGKPKDINKTHFATVTKEQWVYNNKSYVYLENGIVTAIQN